MNKNKTRGYVTLLILAVVLSVISFAIPFAKNLTFWMAYVFGMVAIAFQLYVFKISFSENGDAKSKFYGFPIAQIGVVYLLGQLVISLIEMILASFLPGFVAIVINIIILAVALIGCIAADAMRDEIVEQDIKLKTNVKNMRELQSISFAVASQCTNIELKKELEKLAEEFKYSDIVSSDSTETIENELKRQLEELQCAVIEEDNGAAKILCEKTFARLNERNRLCALNK